MNVDHLIHHRYRVVEIVGAGGEGQVVRAVDTRHDRVVALKMRRLPDEPGAAERIVAEATTLLGLAPHPHLAVARDDFFEDGQHVLVLDWVEGIDLERVLAREGTPGLPVSSVLRWSSDVAVALHALHDNDPPIVHGDVKPANLVLTPEGQVVLVDFGRSSVPGRVARGGTPGFRAPELSGPDAPTPAADVFGLAATIFTLIAGHPPVGGLPEWHGVDPARAEMLEATIRRGLSTDPARRPGSPGQLVEQLRAGWGVRTPAGVETLVLTEIVDAVGLWQRDPDEVPRLLAHFELVVDRATESWNGQRIGMTVEGTVAASSFPRAADAVSAAVEITRTLGQAADGTTRVRTGVHTGRVVTGPSGTISAGPDVHRAAEIRALAAAGQVLVSDTTAAIVASDPTTDVGLVDLGPHRFEGTDQRPHVHAVAAAGLDVPPDPDLAPYPGMFPFQTDDADVFFGRDEVVAEIRRRLVPGEIVAVVGASGVGKSSLLRAGLVPHIPDAIVVRPSDGRPSRDGTLLVDQFEEVFALEPDERAAFIADVVDHRGAVCIAIRADRYGECAVYPALAQAVAANHVLLAPLDTDGLRAAIDEPARQRGLTVEANLADAILADVADQPGSLPLVAHALRETWRRRDGRTLTIASYHAAGGAVGALTNTAEQIYETLDDDGRALLRTVMLRMVEPGEGTDRRRRVPLDELTSLAPIPRVATILDALAAARLVTVADATAEPAHEALLREWPRLRAWIDDERNAIEAQRHLTTAAHAWSERGNDPAELYRGGRLAAAAEAVVAGATLTPLEQSFLTTSRVESERVASAAIKSSRRLRRLLVVASVALVAALITASLALVQRGQARSARDEAVATGLAAEARALAGQQPDLALLLALEAQARDDSAATRSALLETLTTNPQLLAKLHGVQSGLGAAVFSPDGSVIATPTSDGTGTVLWDATTYQPLGEPLLAEPEELDFAAAFTPDGRQLVVVDVVETDEGGPHLQVWDVASRTLNARIDLQVLPEQVAVTADGTTAVVTGQGVVLEPQLSLTGMAVQTVDLRSARSVDTIRLLDEPTDSGVSAVSPDATLALANDGEGLKVELADLTTSPATRIGFDLSGVFDESGGPPYALAVNSAGDRIAVAQAFGRLAIVDRTGRALGPTVESGSDLPSSLEFSPDGTMLALGTSFGPSRLYRIETDGASTVLTEVGIPLAATAAEVSDVSFSADGRRLVMASVDRTGSVWSLDGSRSFAAALDDLDDQPAIAAFPTPDGERLILVGYEGLISSRDLTTNEVRVLGDLDEQLLGASLSPDGRTIAVGGVGGVVHALDASTGSTRWTAPIDGYITSVAFSPDGQSVAVGSDPHRLEPVFDDIQAVSPVAFLTATDGRPDGPVIELSGGMATGLSFSPDSARLAILADNNLVHLADVDARTITAAPLESVDAPFLAVAWSPDGGTIATGNTSGVVQLWDADTADPAAAPGERGINPVVGLAFSADSSMLVSLDIFDRSQLWDVRTGAAIGGTLVGGHLPTTLKTLDLDRLDVMYQPAFSTDGSVLWSVSKAPTAWSLDPAVWRNAACRVANRDLTQTERDRYVPGSDPGSTCSR